MAVITFLSDFGSDSYHTAAFRGALFKAEVHIPFLEISNSIEAFDIVEAAYVSSMVYEEFPERSIHVLATNVVATSYHGHLAAEYNGHFFIAPDNGILPLIFDTKFTNYRRIPTERYEQKIQNAYVPFIKALIESDYQIDQIAPKADEIHTKTKLSPVKDEKEIRGTVLYVDRYGNAYTNIHREELESFISGKAYHINLSRHEQISAIANDFSDVLDGDALCFYSDHNYLVVAIKKGSAEQLLNLRKYKPLIVELE